VLSPSSNFKTSAERAELLALYAELDALLAPYSCDVSGDCCHFATTGREPYPTAVELAEIELAVRARGKDLGRATKRPLPLADDQRRCPLLGEDRRCTIYASRPLGCRTFFCDRMTGPRKLPRPEIQRISRAIADLSARYAPRDPRPRPLMNALGKR
jgi:Fe-S-cluster containining protein